MSSMQSRSQEPIPAWGAKLIMKLKAEGHTRASIARVIGYAPFSVKQSIRHEREHQSVRVPKQGKNKVDDVRWIFAGPNGFQALAELDAVMEQCHDDELLIHVHQQFREAGAYSAAYTTLCNALVKDLKYTSKRVRAIPEAVVMNKASIRARF